MVLVNFSFYLNKRKIKIPVRECKSLFSQIKGLMFSYNSDALLFIFGKKIKQSIHSFFCMPFVAVWFCDGKVVAIEHVIPWRFSVLPQEKFDTLLEIPVGNYYYQKFLVVCSKS